jgi:glyoxylase-like metal-dependent hydrolase (beta-lactamase superfamily II)
MTLTTSSDMAVECIAVGPLGTNCYLVWDTVSKEGVIIDPGEDAERILAKIDEVDILIKQIIATHCHFDHIAAVAALVEKLGVVFLAHEGDISFVEEGKAAARRWGFDIDQPPNPDGWLNEGDTVAVGGIELEIVHTPGHSPGGVCFIHGNVVFAGDCLFQGSIGRTDFRMGDFDELANSIKTKIYTLPDATVVLTGHGPPTTVGDEKRHNPFVRG